MSEESVGNGVDGAGRQGSEPGGRGEGPGSEQGGGNGGGGAPASFDEWLAGQGEEAKGLVTGHIGKLQSALSDERTQRRSLAKQIDDLSKQAEQGSQLRTQLEKLSADFEGASRKAAFYESAPAEVTNLRLAWLVATDAGLLDEKGRTDWAKLREAAPELFKRVTPPANAGAGAKQAGVDDGRSMNAFIRAASGRRVD
jgi:hypothetical protein